jgi:murein L,D-transpeptidase YcbB/YkuD
MPVVGLLPACFSGCAVAKARDIALLVDFLERESQRYELFKSALETIARIGSLTSAEAEARQALEAAQVDLAWAKAELENAQASVVAAKEAARRQIGQLQLEVEAANRLARERHDTEAGRLEAAITEKRAILSKVMMRVKAVQKAVGLIADVLHAEPAPDHPEG